MLHLVRRLFSLLSGDPWHTKDVVSPLATVQGPQPRAGTEGQVGNLGSLRTNQDKFSHACCDRREASRTREQNHTPFHFFPMVPLPIVQTRAF